MVTGSSLLSAMSAAARSARRLSTRSTEELVRQVLARVAAAPDRLAAILADHPDPLIAFGPDRRILAANPAAAQFFGHPADALVGQPTDMLVPARMRQPDAPAMKAFDTLTTVELPGLRADGREPELAWTFGTVDTPPAPIFVMVVRDRAEIDDALEALYASEQRFRFLVEGVRDHAIILLDADGRIATWNAGAERMTGWSADDIIGQPYHAFFPPDDRAGDVPALNLAAAIRDGHHEAVGWRLRKDGSRFHAEASIWPLHTQDGTLQGFAKITHDLTAKRAAEEAHHTLELERAAREATEAGLRRLERVHRIAQALSRTTTREEAGAVALETGRSELGAVGAVLYLISGDGDTLELLDAHGYPAGALAPFASLRLDEVSPGADAIRAMAPLFFEDVDAFVSRYPVYAESFQRDGFEASVALPLIARDRPIGVLALRFRQHHAFPEAERSLLVTIAELCAQALERARLFEAQRAARTEAEAANRAKDEFLAMLGHELRNPLAPIATAVELMKLRGETHSTRERAVIERQVAHITRLVDDLLDVSRITRGKLELALQPVDVTEVIARAVEMASPLLEQRHHRLTMDVAPSLMVQADPARLAQIVSNLLSNAAKYTRPNGQVDIAAWATTDLVAIRVRDNGEGIPAELLPRVFDAFVQGTRTFDRAAGGLGIGLSLVKNLVRLHGGTVRAASAGVPGQGSELTVELPRLRPAAAPEPAPSEAHAAVARIRQRVLVVDDNLDFAEMLASSLRALGYQVRMAGDAVSALDVLREFEAQAAVLDLGLPVLDGFELARQIRDEFPTRTPRLIAVTGYGQAHDRERSAAVGFAEHLVKPIDLNAMVTAIERPDPVNATR